MGLVCAGRTEPHDPRATDDMPKWTSAASSEAPEKRGRRSEHGGRSTAQEISSEKRLGRIIMQNSAAISDVYAMDNEIGKGTYGSVCLGKHKITADVRAVKTVMKRNMPTIKALQKEIAMMKQMDHPNIIKLYETFEDRKAIYMVMELATGGELFDRLVKAKHLSEATTGIVMQQIIRAVFYMHSNDIAHRDLKPENFLFSTKDPIEGNTLKLIDFGLACPSPPGQTLKTKIGTAMYMAPQVVMGRYDKMCDVWSVGVIMYILLSGKAPFMGPSERETIAKVREGKWRFDSDSWDDVSEDAKDLIRSCMRYAPHSRITPEAALNHTWVQQTAPRTAEKHFGEDVLSRMRTFKVSNNVKQAALEVVARQMDDDKIQELTQLFESLDTNGDGQLSITELADGLRRSGFDTSGLDMESVVSRIDGDLSGSIDYTEFLVATMDRKAGLTEHVLWSAFNIFDQNGDGKITVQEMRKALGAANVSSRGVVEAMQAIDSNGDGTIDFYEFIAMVRTNLSPKKLGSDGGLEHVAEGEGGSDGEGLEANAGEQS